MADLYYYEEGYIDAKYHVYVADAEIALGPYIEENYIDAHYYDDYSSVASLTCELTLRPGETVSATGSWTSEFTQTATVGRLQSATADFTSAFSPTLTVDAFKNHTAIIESTTTFTVDAQANRSANVLLEHIANLNAQAAKTAVIDSTMATQATVSAQANHSVVSSATLTSTATVTCLAFNVQFGTVAMSVGSALTTSRFLGTGRPHITSYINPSAYYDASDKLEGTHSIVLSGVGTIYESEPSNAFTINANENFDINFYLKLDHIPTGERTVASYGGSDYAWLIAASNVGIQSLKFYFRNAGGTVLSLNAVDIQTRIGQWMAVRAARIGTSLAFTVDNVGNGTTFTAAFREPASFADRKISIFGVDNTTGGGTKLTKFDFLRYNIASTDIIVLPFNNNSNDFIGITQEGAAAFASTASVTAIGTNAKGAASAGLTSTASVSANAGKLQTVSAALTAAVTQSTAAVKTVQAVLDLTANVSVSATVFRIKEFISDQNALFTPSVAVQAQLAGVALLETQFTQSTSVVKTTDISVTISSTATLSAVSVVTAGLAADLTVSATVSATVTRTQTANIALASESTLACDFTAFNNVAAAFTSTVSVTAAVERYRTTSSTLSTAVTITADVERYRLTSSTPSTTVSVAATVTRIQEITETFNSEFTQVTLAVKTPGIGVSITANATVSVSAQYTAEATATVGALFTPSMDADAQFAGFALLESQSTVTALIGVIKQATNITTTGLQINTSDPYIDDLTGMPFFGLDVRGNNFTASIWARRESTPSTPQTLWSSNSGDSGGLIFSGTNLMLRFNYDPDEPNAVWTNVVPTDGEWHQYLIRTQSKVGNEQNTSSPANGNRWQLWIDGAYQGLSSSYQAQGQIEFNNGGRALFGWGLIADLEVGYTLNTRRLTGAIAQVWMGLTTDNQFNTVQFYDSGFVDFGSTGTLSGLPTPLIYNPLQTPFTGITGTDLTTATTALSYSPTVIRATTLITANAVSLVVANTVITATQTTLISYSVSPVIAVTGSATLTVSATAFTGIIANVVSTATITVDVAKTTGYESALISTVTVFARGGYELELIADLSSTAILDCDFDNIPPTRGEAALTATFTVSADAQSFTDSITLMMSMGTVTCDVTVIPPIRAQADLNSEFALTATIGAIEQFASLVMSAGTMTITAQKTTGIIQTISAVSTLFCEIKHYKGIILNLSAFNSQLTVGEVINIDPYLTLMITAETRGLRILPENREITIESETRVNII